MTLDPRLAVVHQRVQVDCPVQEAFDLFTTRMGECWPLQLASYGGERAREIFLEPHVGGRFFERFVDGDELQVGSVVACEPPRRIAFTWSTADCDGETEVEVTFTPSRRGRGWTWNTAVSTVWDRSVPTSRRSSAAAGRACWRPTRGGPRLLDVSEAARERMVARLPGGTGARPGQRPPAHAGPARGTGRDPGRGRGDLAGSGQVLTGRLTPSG